jgi:hypothetical protein
VSAAAGTFAERGPSQTTTVALFSQAREDIRPELPMGSQTEAIGLGATAALAEMPSSSPHAP